MAQRVTRAQAKRARLEAEQSAAILASCPRELWTLVLSNLSARQIAQAGLVCREWAGIQPAALQLACELRWPEWCSAARAPHSANWKRLHELFEQRERDHGAVGSLAGFGRTQKVVSPRHRAILAEWLIEVAEDWSLESTIVFKAVAYLDHYLSSVNVEVLPKFQLVGIACIRCAMYDAQVKQPFPGSKSTLDPERFAFISDGTFSPVQVEHKTAELHGLITPELRAAPTAKMFLRTFWYRLLQSELATSEEMHLYTVASFFLHLSLVDLGCTGFPACVTAAASLSLSLDVFCRVESWPRLLQQYSGVTLQDLTLVKDKLRQAQSTMPLEHFRRVWRRQPELQPLVFKQKFPEEWQRARQIISYPALV